MTSVVKNIILSNGSFARIEYKDGTEKEIQFPVNALDIQSQLKEQTVKALLRSEESDRIALPIIILPFYFHVIFSKGKVPSQGRLFNSYKAFFNKESKYVLKYTDLPDDKFIRERVFRAQPSLVGDFHFYALCCNSGFFDDVEYNMLKDVKEDCDLTVTKNGKSVKVSLFVRTKESQEWRKKKIEKAKKRNEPLEEVLISCDLSSKQSTTAKMNGYLLYTNDHLDILKAYFKFS